MPSARRSTFIALSKVNVNSASYVLEGDIQSCFDRISHDWLEAHVPMDRTTLHKWLQAGYIDKQTFHPTGEGTPQGGIISPVLANLALDGMERLLRERYPVDSLAQRKAKINFVRFADDFIVTGTSREVLAHEIKPLIEAFLRERGLTLSSEKTVITQVNEGFDFLGQRIRRWDNKLIIIPSERSVQTIRRQVRAIIKANPPLPSGELIARLNPLVRGWANYHRHVCSKQTFWELDNYIFQPVLRWTRRRPRNKNMAWIKQTYFPRRGQAGLGVERADRQPRGSATHDMLVQSE